MRITETLKKLKEERGLSNKQIADELGYDESTVQKWISGKNSIRAEDIETICRKYHLKITDFFDDDLPSGKFNNDIVQLTEIKNMDDVHNLVGKILRFDDKQTLECISDGRDFREALFKRNVLTSIIGYVSLMPWCKHDYYMVVRLLVYLYEQIGWYKNRPYVIHHPDKNNILWRYKCLDLPHEVLDRYDQRRMRINSCYVYDMLLLADKAACGIEPDTDLFDIQWNLRVYLSQALNRPLLSSDEEEYAWSYVGEKIDRSYVFYQMKILALIFDVMEYVGSDILRDGKTEILDKVLEMPYKIAENIKE